MYQRVIELADHTCDFVAAVVYEEVKLIQSHLEKRQPSCTVGGNVSWCSHCGKPYGGSSKHELWNYHTIQQFHFWVFTQRKEVS